MIAEKTVLEQQNMHYNELYINDKRYILHRKYAVVARIVINQFQLATPFSRAK